MTENVIIVSGDGHAMPPPEVLRDYLDPVARDHYDDLVRDNEKHLRIMKVFGRHTAEADEYIDERGSMADGGFTGGWTTSRRLQEMDAEGIAAEVIFWGHQFAVVPFFTPSTPNYSQALQAAGSRSYHRWLADHVADGKGRLLPVGDASGTDMKVTVEELHWLGAHGFVAVQLPGHCSHPDLPPLYDRFYEPFWQTCVEQGLRVAMHAGWGQPKESISKFYDAVLAKLGDDVDQIDIGKIGEMMMDPTEKGESPIRIDATAPRAMWQMIVGGVFDRYPDLRFVVTEVRADWVPGMMAAMEAAFEAGGAPMKKRPTDYFREHCYVAPSFTHRREVELREQIGVDRIVFGRDYPHPEGTWPNTLKWLQAAFYDVREDELRRMLGQNAIECYKLDRAKMQSIADRIGHRPSDILGEHAIEQRFIDHFDARGGFLKPEPAIDRDAVATSLAEDLVGASR
jgi:predicted TIM-barrel fold metal-dependent hydrolase